MKKWEKPMLQELGLSYTEEEVLFYKPGGKPEKKICYCDQTKYTYGLGCGHEYSPHKNNCPYSGPVLRGNETLPMCS